MNNLIEWDKIKLVIFDVDGTLYYQKKLRLAMLLQLCKHVVTTLDFSVFPILKCYRDMRETLGENEVFDFEKVLVEKTCLETGYSNEKVVNVIKEWIEIKPLKYLHDAKFEGLDALFSALREEGKVIGILSDYKAAEKLVALGLEADLIVSAQDNAINMLKPNPKGLHYLVRQANVALDETILIGDRDARDGEAARRAGTHYLIKKMSGKPLNDHQFLHYSDAIFGPLLRKHC